MTQLINALLIIGFATLVGIFIFLAIVCTVARVQARQLRRRIDEEPPIE